MNLLDGIVQQEAIVVLGREIVDQLPSLPVVQGAIQVHYKAGIIATADHSLACINLCL